MSRELDRLRHDDGVYAAIAGLTRSLPRVDVIAGSSVATVVAYYGVHTWDDRPSWIDPVAVTTAIALLAGGATALGYGAGRFRLKALFKSP